MARDRHPDETPTEPAPPVPVEQPAPVETPVEPTATEDIEVPADSAPGPEPLPPEAYMDRNPLGKGPPVQPDGWAAGTAIGEERQAREDKLAEVKAAGR